MRSHKRTFLLVVWIGISCLLTQKLVASDLRKRFEAEYPAAAGGLRDNLSQVVAKGQIRRRDARGVDTQSDVVFSCLGENVKVVRVFPDREEVKCANRLKLFELERPTHNDPWVVLKVFGPVSDSAYRFFKAQRLDMWCQGHLCVYQTPLTDWMGTPEFVLRDVTLQNDGDREQVVLNCEFTQLTAANPAGVRRAEVRLSPAESWAIREYEIEFEPQNVAKQTMRGIVVPRTWDGVVFPERVEHHIVTTDNDGKVYNYDEVFECTDVSLDPNLAESDFSMTSFSLPELTPIPRQSPVPQPRTYWPLVVIVNAAIGISIVYYLVTRRRKAQSP